MKFQKNFIVIFSVLVIFLILTTPILGLAQIPPDEPSSKIKGLVPCDGSAENPCGICQLFELVSIIVNFITYKIAAPLATIMLIYGGVMLIISGGSEDRKKKGLNAIWAAVWGLVIVFGAWLIVNTIINSLAKDAFSGGWNKFPGCP